MMMMKSIEIAPRAGANISSRQLLSSSVAYIHTKMRPARRAPVTEGRRPPRVCVICATGELPGPRFAEWQRHCAGTAARWPVVAVAARAAGPLLLVVSVICVYVVELRSFSPLVAAAGLLLLYASEFLPLSPVPFANVNSFTVAQNAYAAAGVGLALFSVAALALADILAAVEEWSNAVSYRRGIDTELIWSLDGAAALSLLSFAAPVAAVMTLAFQLHWAPSPDIKETA